MNIFKNLGFSRSFVSKMRLEFERTPANEQTWRAKTYRALVVLDAIEAEAIKELSFLSARDWVAIFAAFNGLIVDFREDKSVRSMIENVGWQFREWCRYSAGEAAQFGDPAAMAASIGEDLEKVSFAAKAVVLMSALDAWNDPSAFEDTENWLLDRGFIVKQS